MNKPLNIDVDELLESTEKCLRISHTPKPYEVNLIIDVYDLKNKEFWIHYQKDHDDMVVRFFDHKGLVYNLIEGNLYSTGKQIGE